MGGRLWTEDDMNFLEENWGVKPIPYIAKKLNRTISSVKSKARKSGLGRHLHAREEITLNILINTLGYKACYSWMKSKLEKNNCPIEYRGSMKVKYRVVKMDKFWKWAEKNQDLLNFCDFEKNALGKEPKWVDVKRKLDIKKYKEANSKKLWTAEEDSLLLAKVKSGRFNYGELARDLNRSEGAVRRRLDKLDTFEKPNSRYNGRWTVEQNNKMIELYQKGYNSRLIALELGKSELSINTKLRKIKKEIPLLIRRN